MTTRDRNLCSRLVPCLDDFIRLNGHVAHTRVTTTDMRSNHQGMRKKYPHLGRLCTQPPVGSDNLLSPRSLRVSLSRGSPSAGPESGEPWNKGGGGGNFFVKTREVVECHPFTVCRFTSASPAPSLPHLNGRVGWDKAGQCHGLDTIVTRKKLSRRPIRIHPTSYHMVRQFHDSKVSNHSP